VTRFGSAVKVEKEQVEKEQVKKEKAPPKFGTFINFAVPVIWQSRKLETNLFRLYGPFCKCSARSRSLFGKSIFPQSSKSETETIMNKHAATLLILMLAALPGLVSAQTGSVIRTNVPFEFVANGKTMPMGPCTISVQGDGAATLWISSGNTHLIAVATRSESRDPSERTTLLFHRYGDRYFLAGISTQGENRGFELPAGKVEIELQAQKAGEKDITLVASVK
jgi:hypothetical protein